MRSIKLLLIIFLVAILPLSATYVILGRIMAYNERVLGSIAEASEFNNKLNQSLREISLLKGKQESEAGKIRKNISESITAIEENRRIFNASGILSTLTDGERAALDGGINQFLFSTKQLIKPTTQTKTKSKKKKKPASPVYDDKLLHKILNNASSGMIPAVEKVVKSYIDEKKSVMGFLNQSLSKYAPFFFAFLAIFSLLLVKILEMIKSKRDAKQQPEIQMGV